MRVTVASIVFVCTCMGTIFMTSSPADAFSLTGYGGKLGYVTPEDLGGTLTAGAHLELEQQESHFHLIPSLMYWKTDNVSDFSANADVYYHFVRDGFMSPYLGAGLGLNFFGNDRSNQSNSKLGANLFGGLLLPAPGFRYFVEGRYTASDISQFAVLGGITFHVGSGR